MIKAALFDMDGVLYDSMPSHAQAWYDVMTSYGIECKPEDFYLYEGRTGFSTINLLFNQSFGRDAAVEEQKEIYEKKCVRFVELDKSTPMPGALDVLKKVRELGITPLIVTGSGQVSLIRKLDASFPGFFRKELMVTAYDVKFGKPHPEPYLMGLEKAGVKASEAIVIENAPLGVESAKAAGIYTIAVNTGPLPDKILLEAGADCIYRTMYELLDDLKAKTKRSNF
jgi:HAD superfamily hydrolase (TIGR01509 family)